MTLELNGVVFPQSWNHQLNRRPRCGCGFDPVTMSPEPRRPSRRDDFDLVRLDDVDRRLGLRRCGCDGIRLCANVDVFLEKTTVLAAAGSSMTHGRPTPSGSSTSFGAATATTGCDTRSAASPDGRGSTTMCGAAELRRTRSTAEARRSTRLADRGAHRRPPAVCVYLDVERQLSTAVRAAPPGGPPATRRHRRTLRDRRAPARRTSGPPTPTPDPHAQRRPRHPARRRRRARASEPSRAPIRRPSTGDTGRLRPVVAVGAAPARRLGDHRH